MSRALRSLVILASALLPLSGHAAEMFLSKDDVGQLWIQITGRIDDGDDAKFKGILVDAIRRGDQIVNVSIYSPGGQAIPAMAIGRSIRTMHLSTAAPDLIPLVKENICRIYTPGGRTTVLDYKPWIGRGDPRCTCADECFLIWAAGATRLGGAVVIRPGAFQADEPSGAGGRGSVHDYLLEMGVPSVVTERLFGISSEAQEYLTKDEHELLEYKMGFPRTEEPYRSRCRRHAPTSPAAYACERTITWELYWEGAKRLLGETD